MTRQVSIYGIYTYGAFKSLDVFTVTGVRRREPWRPYGRVVSLVRALHELSVLPWRWMPASLRVMVAADAAALPHAARCGGGGEQVGGGGGGGCWHRPRWTT